MIPVLSSLLAWVGDRLPGAERNLQVHRDPWVTFLQGRTLDHRGDTRGAFCCHLQAAQAGLPVATVMIWLTYRIGHGVPADPVAASAWADRARSADWPDVLEPGGQ